MRGRLANAYHSFRAAIVLRLDIVAAASARSSSSVLLARRRLFLPRWTLRAESPLAYIAAAAMAVPPTKQRPLNASPGDSANRIWVATYANKWDCSPSRQNDQSI